VGRSRTKFLRLFLKIEFTKSVERTTPTKASRGSTSRAVDAGGKRPGRGLTPASHFLPAGSSRIWGGEGTPSGVIHSVYPWSSGRTARSVSGFDGVLGVPALDGFARWRNTIFCAFIGFSEDLFRLRRRIVAPSLPLLRQERVRSALHSLCVRFVTHSYCSTRLRPMRSDPRGRETPPRFQHGAGSDTRPEWIPPLVEMFWGCLLQTLVFRGVGRLRVVANAANRRSRDQGRTNPACS